MARKDFTHNPSPLELPCGTEEIVIRQSTRQVKSPHIVDLSSLFGTSNEDSVSAAQARSVRNHPRVIARVSHILAWLLLCGGLLAVPLFSIWAYKEIAEKKGEVLGVAIRAVEELEQAKPKLENFELEGAYTHFKNAYELFSQLQATVGIGNSMLKTISPLIPRGKSYYYASRTGLLVSNIGEVLSDVSAVKGAEQSKTSELKILYSKLKEARPLLREAFLAIEQVKEEDFDEAQRSNIRSLREYLIGSNQLIDPTIETVEKLIALLGEEKTVRYLFLFQNTGEMRPTGGFAGSLALVDVYKGEITKVIQPKGGSYDLHYGMFKVIRAPAPFRVLNPRWEIQDCNWFPDFRFSAQKCAWFLEDAFGTSVDGVIALNVDTVSDFLRIVGPISVSKYDVTIDADNFIPTTQIIVDSSKNTKEPKRFLADVFPLLVDRIVAYTQNEKGVFGVVRLLENALEKKDIMMYSFDPEIQTWLEERNWAGAIRERDGDRAEVERAGFRSESKSDYIFVNTATVNGGKSDFGIKETVYYVINQGAEGYLTATVEITRQHTVERLPKDAAVSQRERDFNALIAQPNVSYIRVYSPMGSKLISVEGDIFDPTPLRGEKADLHDGGQEDAMLSRVEQDPLIHEDSGTRISREFGKTVFGNYLEVLPGNFGRLVFTYQLPLKNESLNTYRLATQKQSGKIDRLIVRYQDVVLYDGLLDKDLFITR